MNDLYFTHHYSHINRINLESEESVRQWFTRAKTGYELELSPYLHEMHGKKVLDLGCGIGGVLHYVMGLGTTEILGVDHSEDQLEICKKYVTQMVENADVIEYLKRRNGKYDYIIALDLIEHLPKSSIGEFCQLIYASLNDGGEVLLRTPNMGSLFGLRSRYIDFTHEVGFTEESISQVLRGGGFTKISAHNNYIGKKRLWCVRLFQRSLEKLYNVALSRIVTQNMIVVAAK